MFNSVGSFETARQNLLANTQPETTTMPLNACISTDHATLRSRAPVNQPQTVLSNPFPRSPQNLHRIEMKQR